jgi:hypothetical protein
MKYYLKEDIINSKTRVPYGVKGEVVTTISLHDKCHIVEGEKQNRFGVNESLLSEEFIEKEILKTEKEIKKRKK